MKLDKVIDAITAIHAEENNLLKFMHSLNLSPGQKILDVGCGFGAKLKLLRANGFNVIGVDANQKTVAANVAAGMHCMSVSDFNQTNELYDVLLFSHVIEHFMPCELLRVMDGYLERLKVGGHLIIATPLYSPYFYEDFDHIKPYHPTGINMVFETNSAQVQYYSKNRLKLVDIWFRKSPFKLIHSPGLYVGKGSKMPIIINISLALFFRLSFGCFGRTDGWMGLYRKIAS